MLKKLKINKIQLLTAVAIAATTSVAHSYDAFYSVPGTRAMGMAGAFVAQADDSTAMHYNPAGLAHEGPKYDVTVEYGNKLSWNSTDGRNKGNTDLKWASFRAGNLGIAHYKPLSFGSTSTGLIEYSVTSFGAGRDLGDGLKAGITMDLVSVSGQKSDNGYGFSLGFLKELAKNQDIFGDIKFDLSAGLLIRNEAEMGTIADPTSAVSRPGEQTWGINAKFQNLIPSALVSVNYSNSNTQWDRAAKNNPTANYTIGLDYVREAFGAEISFATSSDMQVIARIGKSYAKAASSEYIDSNNTTYGMGIILGSFAVDFASEKRNISNGTESYNLTSVSGSYFF